MKVKASLLLIFCFYWYFTLIIIPTYYYIIYNNTSLTSVLFSNTIAKTIRRWRPWPWTRSETTWWTTGCPQRDRCNICFRYCCWWNYRYSSRIFWIWRCVSSAICIRRRPVVFGFHFRFGWLSSSSSSSRHCRCCCFLSLVRFSRVVRPTGILTEESGSFRKAQLLYKSLLRQNKTCVCYCVKLLSVEYSRDHQFDLINGPFKFCIFFFTWIRPFIYILRS